MLLMYIRAYCGSHFNVAHCLSFILYLWYSVYFSSRKLSLLCASSAAAGHNTNSSSIKTHRKQQCDSYHQCWPMLSAHTHINTAAAEGWYHVTCGASEHCSCRAQRKRDRGNDRSCVYNVRDWSPPTGRKPHCSCDVGNHLSTFALTSDLVNRVSPKPLGEIETPPLC